jgi:DtxR family Mn-dependent transcriptional regulator
MPLNDPLILLLIAAGLVATTSGLFWPRVGLLARWRRSRLRSAQVLREDALKYIHGCQLADRRLSLEGLAGVLEISANQGVQVLADLEKRGLVVHGPQGYRLTSRGRKSALHILRAHRLWERYLADQTGFQEVEWHDRADLVEHQLNSDQLHELASQLGHPTHDPHGDPIPTAEGEWVRQEGITLDRAETGESYRIVHMEDEPPAVYAQLLAEGLHLGQNLRVIERSERSIRFWAQGDEHVLAPLLAENLTLKPLKEEAHDFKVKGDRLSDLDLGEQGEVLGLSPACRGPGRRRLLDLGLVPGTMVSTEMISPGGDPKAYRIRSALIALRQEQADFVLVTKEGLKDE